MLFVGPNAVRFSGYILLDFKQMSESGLILNEYTFRLKRNALLDIEVFFFAFSDISIFKIKKRNNLNQFAFSTL